MFLLKMVHKEKKYKKYKNLTKKKTVHEIVNFGSTKID